MLEHFARSGRRSAKRQKVVFCYERNPGKYAELLTFLHPRVDIVGTLECTLTSQAQKRVVGFVLGGFCKRLLDILPGGLFAAFNISGNGRDSAHYSTFGTLTWLSAVSGASASSCSRETPPSATWSSRHTFSRSVTW